MTVMASEPAVLPAEDWRSQLRARLRSLPDLDRVLCLTAEEREALERGMPVPVAVTPYYLELLKGHGPDYPLRRAVIPHIAELEKDEAEVDDPLGETQREPVPDLVHTYPDRVLLLATDRCAVYCRFCTRRRLFQQRRRRGLRWWDRVLDYIRNHTEVREVILSGGDPLMLSDEVLARLLADLRRIPHVEQLRIHTRMPAVLPSRVTDRLAAVLRRHQPLWVIHHLVHPDELTPEFAAACNILADRGIPMGNQTVLLRGINDDEHTTLRLMQGLVRVRVKPYYLHYCDPAPGTAHFRTSIQRGQEIIRFMYGRTSGLSVPLFVVDQPGGGHKTPIMPR